MRTIKFRAWHPDEGNMYYFNCFKEITDWQADDFYRADNTDDACVDFMQFTGLHDKNGKEIYEGDIVKSFFVDTDEAGNEIYKYYIIEVKYDEVLCSYKIDKFMNLEVIGNIYENKELLNEANR